MRTHALRRWALAAALTAGAAACSDSAPGGPAKTDAEQNGHTALKLYALNCGVVEMLDLSIFDVGGAYDGMQNSAVVTCYLLRHPKGDLLWDTGLPDALHDIEGGVTSGAFHLQMPKTLKSQLAELGLQLSDIDYLSLSHSHFDHTGNAGEYASATFIVHEAERAHMFRDEARADAQSFASYAALESSNTITYTDEYDVFGDGSARIIAMPGHTPGHSVLLATLQNSGALLLTGDLYHLTQARKKRTVPVFNTDIEETRRSMDRFEALAVEKDARVIIQHEADDFADLPKPPAYLD